MYRQTLFDQVTIALRSLSSSAVHSTNDASGCCWAGRARRCGVRTGASAGRVYADRNAVDDDGRRAARRLPPLASRGRPGSHCSLTLSLHSLPFVLLSRLSLFPPDSIEWGRWVELIALRFAAVQFPARFSLPLFTDYECKVRDFCACVDLCSAYFERNLALTPQGLILDKCRHMKSKKLPLWLVRPLSLLIQQ